MAHYDITHTCGHDERIELFGKTSERERRIEWLQERPCTECWKKERAAEAEARKNKEAAMIVEKLGNDAADVQAWLESMLTQHVEAVEAALDAVDEMTETQGHAPSHVDLLYYRSQEHYDRYGRDKGDYAIVNARSREIAAILESEGIEARFRYPEDDEAGFQRLANTR